MRLFIAYCALVCVGALHAQDDDKKQTFSLSEKALSCSYRLYANRGRVLRLDEEERNWLKTNKAWSVGLEVSKWALQKDSCSYDALYNYPALSWGLMVGDYKGTQMIIDEKQDTSVGMIYTLYGRFDRPLWRCRNWKVGYGLGLGAAYASCTYHPRSNTNNRLIGSHMNIFFSFSLWYSYFFSPHWSADMTLLFAHHSNGASARPNKGVNFVAPQLSLSYYPQGEDTHGNDALFEGVRMKRWLFPLHIGIGGKALQEEYLQAWRHPETLERYYKHGHYKYHPSVSLSASALYRYAQRWASGIGVDLNYASGAMSIKRLDAFKEGEWKHSPFSIGMAIRHEAYYKHLAASLSLGAYLFRRMGETAGWEEKWYYERVGLKYYWREGASWYAGLEVKAHSTKADFTELIVGYRF